MRKRHSQFLWIFCSTISLGGIASADEIPLNASSTNPKAISQHEFGFKYFYNDYGLHTDRGTAFEHTYTDKSNKTIYFKNETSVNYIDNDPGHAADFSVGPGFAYLIQDDWTISGYLRAGVEHHRPSDALIRNFGFEFRHEKYFETSKFFTISLENDFGYSNYNALRNDNNGDSHFNDYFFSRNLFGVDFSLSDTGLLDVGSQARLKARIGSEKLFGTTDDVDNTYIGIISLRDVDKQSGEDRIAFEIEGKFGNNNYHGIIGGVIITY